MAASASASESAPAAVEPGVLYSHQRELASLPVPELDQTLEKLLRSVKPHVTEEEFTHTQAVCKEFASGVGKELQELLEERGASMRNWVRPRARRCHVVPRHRGVSRGGQQALR